MGKITNPEDLAILNAQQAPDPGMPINPIAVAGKKADIRRTEVGTTNDILTGQLKANDVAHLGVINALQEAELQKKLADLKRTQVTQGLPTEENPTKMRIFGNSGARALQELNTLDQAPRNWFQAQGNKWAPWVMNQLPDELSGNTEKRILADSAEKRLIDAIARARSGAAISDKGDIGDTPEYQRYVESYLPKPGATIEETRLLRSKAQAELQDLMREGGFQLSTKVGNDFMGVPKLADPTGRMAELPVPKEFQDAVNKYYDEHPRGKLDPVAYAEFMMGLNKQFGYGQSPDDVKGYTDFAAKYNDPKENIDRRVPGPTSELTPEQQQMNAKGQEPFGALLGSMANSALMGAPSLNEDFSRKLGLMEEQNPLPAFLGNMAGGVVGSEGLGMAGGAIAKKLAPWLMQGGTRGNVARTFARDATYGGTTGANESTSGDPVADALMGATIGGGSSIVGQGLGKGLTPLQSEGSQEALAQLKNVDLTTFQRLGDRAASTEEALTGIPGIRGSRARAEISFNQDNMNRALSLAHDPETGAVLELPKGTKPGAESNLQASRMLSDNYDKILPNIQGAVDTPYLDGMQKIWEPFYFPASGKGKPTLRDANLKSKVENLRSIAERELFDSAGDFDGKAFKSASVKLRELAGKYSSSQDEDIRELGQAASKLRDNLHELGMRVNPKLAEALKATDAAWARLMRIEVASASAATEDGIYGAPQYWQAIKQLDGSPRKKAIAEGRGLDQKYAEAAKKILGGKTPTKVGLWPTLAATGVVSGGSFLNPALGALGAAGAGAAYLPGLKRGTQKLLTGNRGKDALPAADMITQALIAKHRTNNSKDK